MKEIELLKNKTVWYHVYLAVLTGLMFRFYNMGILGYVLYVMLAFLFFSLAYTVFLGIRKLVLSMLRRFRNNQRAIDGIREDYIRSEK